MKRSQGGLPLTGSSLIATTQSEEEEEFISGQVRTCRGLRAGGQEQQIEKAQQTEDKDDWN
eukprot:747854-Hanusia_phi.AAC.3